MSKLRVSCFALSADGYGAGPGQDLHNPLGVGGEQLHGWLVSTRFFQQTLLGREGGESGLDDDFARSGFENVGAWILGRNMFGPVRGPWPDDAWKGWWGDEPPYRCPVFVLTHHARASVEMKGGTVFHFETGGLRAALDRARVAARGKDVRVGGGVSTVRQYLREKLIDEMHFAVSPVLLGSGESLFAGLDLPALGYQVSRHAISPQAAHLVLTK